MGKKSEELGFYFEKIDWDVAEGLGLHKSLSNQPPMNQADIAKNMGISQQLVGLILKSALRKLRKAMVEKNKKKELFRKVILKGR